MKEQYDDEPYSPKPKPETPWVAPKMKIGVYKRKNGRYQVYFSHEGKQIHLQRLPWGIPLDSDTRVALLKAYLRKYGYHPEKWGQQEKPFNFDYAIRTWIKTSTASPEWILHKQQLANKFFLPFFKRQDIRQIKTIHIQQFYASLLEKGYSSKYISTLMGQLKAFFRFNQKSLKDGLPDFPKVSTQEKPIKWLTEEDQDKIFQHIPDRDKPIFEALRHYGLRCNEAGGMLKKNVFLSKNYFVIASTLGRNGKIRESTKTRKVRVLPIVPSTKWIFESKGDSEFVFSKGKCGPYTNRRLNSVWRKANRLSGVPVIPLRNAVRHSFACQRLNSGYSIEEIRVVLGHSTSKTTQKYAQYDLKSLAGIINGNAPVIENKEPKLLENKGKGETVKKLSPRPF
jgi:integrase